MGTAVLHEPVSAVASASAPRQALLIGDLGDNGNAGASCDVPFVTRRLLQWAASKHRRAASSSDASSGGASSGAGRSGASSSDASSGGASSGAASSGASSGSVGAPASASAATRTTPIAPTAPRVLITTPIAPTAPTVLIAGLVDGPAAQRCRQAGKGARLASLVVGGAHAVGTGYGEGCEPLRLTDVRVLALVNNSLWAVVQPAPSWAPSVTLVLQESPWAFFGRDDVARLTDAYHPSKYDVIVVKRGNVESLGAVMGARHDGGTRITCLMARTPGANALPLPPRRHLRAAIFQSADSRGPGSAPAMEHWVAPLGAVPPRYVPRLCRARAAAGEGKGVGEARLRGWVSPLAILAAIALVGSVVVARHR